jgi:hypothetical protein
VLEFVGMIGVSLEDEFELPTSFGNYITPQLVLGNTSVYATPMASTGKNSHPVACFCMKSYFLLANL